MVAAALLLALAGVACAQDKGFYVGGGAGRSKARDPADCSGVNGLVVSNCMIEDTKTAWKVFAGYQFSPYLALEGGYADLGKFKTSLLLNSLSEVSVTDHPTLYGLDVVGTLPLAGGFGLLGRIGWFHWTLDANSNLSVPLPGVEPFQEKAHGNKVSLGVGAKWDFAQHLGARIEYQRFPKIGNDDVGQSDVDLLSASLLFRF